MSDITLNPTQLGNRVQWVRDLTSGEFQQAQHALKILVRTNDVEEADGYGYCCLGVACQRIDPDIYSLQIDDHRGWSHGSSMNEAFAAEHFGLHGKSDQGTAMSWNDTKRYSFARIADLIAYATEHSLYFNEVDEVIERVSYGYATEWLVQFDDTTV